MSASVDDERCALAIIIVPDNGWDIPSRVKLRRDKSERKDQRAMGDTYVERIMPGKSSL